MNQSRSIVREIGTAFAVLAIYLLTVLAPLHHARASQLAFQDLGYATIQSGWVLCNPAGTGGQDNDLSVAKCPATGVGKTEFALPALAIVPLARSVVALAAPFHAPSPLGLGRPMAPSGGPRAPPIAV